MIYLLHPLYLFYFLSTLVCVYVLYKKSKSVPIDPGFMLVFVTFFSVTACIIFYELVTGGKGNQAWILWESRGAMQNVVLLNAVFTVTFTLCYSFFISLKPSKNTYTSVDAYKSLYDPVYWLVVYAIVFMVDRILLFLGQTWIMTYWGNVLDLSFMIALASLLLKIKGMRTTMIVLFLMMLFAMYVYYPIIVTGIETDPRFATDEVYSVNKGGVVKMLIFCFCET